MQTEGSKLIFIMKFSVLDFFKFTSRMPQIVFLVLPFKNFQGEHAPGSPRYFLFFFLNSNSRLVQGKLACVTLIPSLQIGDLSLQIDHFVEEGEHWCERVFSVQHHNYTS